MKKAILILFLSIKTVLFVLGQPYLAQSKTTDCYNTIVEKNIEARSLANMKSQNLDCPTYFTYIFSNKCGFPTVDIYCRENSPHLLHDKFNNQMYYLGYCCINGDTTIFYTDISDFWPNGVAESFVKTFELIRDTIFDHYQYRTSSGNVMWYERTDDGPVYHYKIKKNGKFKRISKKKSSKLSKWYIQTYRVTPPPCPPPALPKANIFSKMRQKNRIKRYNKYWGVTL